MGEEESKELEAFLTEAAKTFNQWVITNPTQLPLRAIDKGLISWIAALPIEQFETILSQVLTVFARFWWLRDMGKKLEPPTDSCLFIF